MHSATRNGAPASVKVTVPQAQDTARARWASSGDSSTTVPLGSRLVAETFHGLVAGSDHSILAQPGWKSSLTAAPADKYTMVDLLTFVDDVNPLGD